MSQEILDSQILVNCDACVFEKEERMEQKNEQKKEKMESQKGLCRILGLAYQKGGKKTNFWNNLSDSQNPPFWLVWWSFWGESCEKIPSRLFDSFKDGFEIWSKLETLNWSNLSEVCFESLMLCKLKTNTLTSIFNAYLCETIESPTIWLLSLNNHFSLLSWIHLTEQSIK